MVEGEAIKSYEVSIHAPYIGSDWTETDFFLKLAVSIHAPYIGSD